MRQNFNDQFPIGKKRVFGRDITNKQLDCESLTISTTQNPLKENYIKVKRTKNFSMDENLLNRTFNQNSIFLKNTQEEFKKIKVTPYKDEPDDIHMQTVENEEQSSFNTYLNINNEYLEEIYLNLLQEESLKFSILEYLKEQKELNEKMRCILVSWLFDVCLKFGLKQDTFYLSIRLIDLYLSVKVIKRNILQLIGTSCLFIACKYEEIFFPEIRDFVYACDKAFNKAEILEMEYEILSKLEFDIHPMFASRYLEIIAATLKLGEKDLNFCFLMLDLFNFDYRINKFSPSVVACSCIFINYKLKKCSNQECNEIIKRFLNFNVDANENVRECVYLLCGLLDNLASPFFKKVKEKYSNKDLNEVIKQKIFFVSK